jgi:hypothetical protein
MVRYTRAWGVIVVDPAKSNRERLIIIGQALYGDVWHRRVCRDLRVSTSVMGRWVGTGEPDRNCQPPDAIVKAGLELLRRRIDQLEFAIEEVRLLPWLD